MIDLDVSLELASERASTWSEQDAVNLSTRLREGLGLWVQYEPPDEEWIVLQGNGPYVGMISVYLPIATVTMPVGAEIARLAPEVVVVTINDFLASELRASPETLRSTVLSYGWDDDFDTEAFSANDLFVTSI